MDTGRKENCFKKSEMKRKVKRVGYMVEGRYL